MMTVSVNINADIDTKTSDNVVSFGLRILEPFGLISDIVSDGITSFRTCNIISIGKKAINKLEQCGSEPQAVSTKFLARFIEEASYEDDPELQDMWANLLAGESINHSPINQSYIPILKELDTNTANLLSTLYQHAQSSEFNSVKAIIDQNIIKDLDGGLPYDSKLKSRDNLCLISHAEYTDFNLNNRLRYIVLPEIGINNAHAFTNTNKDITQLDQLKNMGLAKIYSEKTSEIGSGILHCSVYGVITPFGYGFISACKNTKTNNDEVYHGN